MCDHILSFNPRDDKLVRCGVCDEKWYKVPCVWVDDGITVTAGSNDCDSNATYGRPDDTWDYTECSEDCTVHSDTSTDDSTFHDDNTTNWDNVPGSYTTCK